ncbi:MAG: ABC transporter permease, partial [Proteobacteria bacterium]|nr:ABC transporter permease [Pseudomonadota bacterium]
MFQALEIFIGLRYLRTRQQNRFVSFITLASLIGVALGVAALIVVLSVMNGFENELRGRLLSMTSHATVAAARGGISEWRELIASAQRQPDVVGAAPYVQLQGMLANGSVLNGALVRGINPRLEKTVDRVGDFMVQGTLDELQTAGYNMVLGRLLALRLGVDVGDRWEALAERPHPAPMTASWRLSIAMSSPPWRPPGRLIKPKGWSGKWP